MAALRPWWETQPTTPAELVERTAETPAIGAGGAGATMKIIHKGGSVLGKLALVGGGALLGSLFFGGRDQQQEQEAEQPTTVIPKQTTTQEQRATAFQRLLATIKARQEARLAAEVTPTVTPTVGGGTIGTAAERSIQTYAPVTKTTTITTTGVTSEQFAGVLNVLAQIQGQQAAPIQTTTVTPTITQGQEATSLDMGLIAILAAAGIIVLGSK